MCRRGALRWGRLLRQHGFGLAPLQSPVIQERIGHITGDKFTEVKLLKINGELIGGVDVYAHVARHLWWGVWFYWLTHVPGVRYLLKRIYRWIAENRHCLGGSCSITQTPRWPGILPLAALPGIPFLWQDKLPSWVFMWLTAGSIYLAMKWNRVWDLHIRRDRLPRWRTLAFLLFWPGMDAEQFIFPAKSPPVPSKREWEFALGKMLLGIVLIGWFTEQASRWSPLAAGWAGAVGTIFVLHFGLFHLLSLIWRTAGMAAAPIMQAPIYSTSLNEFWSRRWNMGFRDLATTLIFRRLIKHVGLRNSLLITFLISGLVHELVISLPAQAGYGLPTIYFLIQGMGIVAERSMWARRIGLGSGRRGWLFTLIVTAGPIGLLFHRPFMLNVVVPFLDAIGGL